ncbi:unnamed protein product [Rangifer tarandus platyrhynchus]|uniref:Uncharacterized protein n=1 Tax=Rangifer tarandus platyrhynchus TaxID=3082113 RepID=A0ABN8XN05_RANTA|nr:unnamed protein product [Rangifer tarandus platyrhynchus]
MHRNVRGVKGEREAEADPQQPPCWVLRTRWSSSLLRARRVNCSPHKAYHRVTSHYATHGRRDTETHCGEAHNGENSATNFPYLMERVAGTCASMQDVRLRGRMLHAGFRVETAGSVVNFIMTCVYPDPQVNARVQIRLASRPRRGRTLGWPGHAPRR